MNEINFSIDNITIYPTDITCPRCFGAVGFQKKRKINYKTFSVNRFYYYCPKCNLDFWHQISTP